MSQPIHLVDVFAERPFSGNPLAVVICRPAVDEGLMQHIAAEMNFSETTFVLPDAAPNGGYPVRIFTPAREIAFAGHPILGTAWVIRRQLQPQAVTVRLNLAVGQVPVRFEIASDGRETAWFEAPPMTLGPICTHAAIAKSLGLAVSELNTDYPPQMISAGTAAMIVPLRDLAALNRARLDLDRHSELAAQGFPPLIYLVCRETLDAGNDLSVRFFFEAHGVREDPATGNGAAFFGAYLLEHGYLPGDRFDLRIEQGHAVQRPSLVLLRADRLDATHRISVGGYVVATVKGELLSTA